MTHLRESELPEFAKGALRAHRRADKKLRAENKRLGLPLIVWKDGKLVREKL
ncbi:hypothetical protein ACFQY0_07805 [Haloferula chungangensis]|uniref:Uncharacterized protein n=1 Tax=Haloferula chungangensis TaxID=1048331 RepID=A0ABW2L410_9BACT